MLRRIRDYGEGDLPRLREIDRICFPPGIAYSGTELLFYLRHRRSITKVAESQSGIIGFAIGRLEDEWTAHVITLDVLPEARRRGVGTALMTALHGEFAGQGVLSSYLEVNASDSGALRFYERLHYRQVETLRGYYPGRQDALRMVRLHRERRVGL